MKKNLDMRIGIVGAGPAGLTAAEALKAKGYTNVTLLEKRSLAGGKCCSVVYEGRSYELGAGIISANNNTIFKLAKKFGVKVAPIDFSRDIIFWDSQNGKRIRQKSLFTEKLSLLRQLFLTYKQLALRYKKITESGLAHVDADLCMPFSQWAAKYKIPLVARELEPFFTGFGYGYFDEIPAAYVLKYYSWPTLKSFIKKSIHQFPDGINNLWTTVAKDHHVLYDASIKKIRRGEVVTIETAAGELEFDALILACPLDDSLLFLDATEEEKNLFSNISYYDYRTYACVLKNFPRQDGYIPGNFTSSRKGHPIFWHSRYKDSDLFTFYVIGDWKMTDEVVQKNIEEVVRQLGGALEQVYTVAHWKYFPHVDAENMKNGFFDKVENLQGKNNTYYTGELLNFSTVELSAEYSENLIEKWL